MTEHRPIIVVTGGNRGIGFEICRQLASRGAQVVLTARKPDAGQEAVKQLRPGRAESVGAIAPAGYDQGGEHRGIVRVSGAELWPPGCIGQ